MKEPEKTVEEKQKDFLDKYGKLVDETGMDMAIYPVYVPDGKGGFTTTIQQTVVDMSKRPKPSPFVAQ